MNANVRIQKETDDPICLRASIGGTSVIGYYLTYRGDREKILDMLQEAVAALEAHCKTMPELKPSAPIKRANFGSS